MQTKRICIKVNKVNKSLKNNQLLSLIIQISHFFLLKHSSFCSHLLLKQISSHFPWRPRLLRVYCVCLRSYGLYSRETWPAGTTLVPQTAAQRQAFPGTVGEFLPFIYTDISSDSSPRDSRVLAGLGGSSLGLPDIFWFILVA